MSWLNTDGLYIKYGTEETAVSRGGEVDFDGMHEYHFYVDYTDALSTSNVIVGTASGTETGSMGPFLPKGLRIQQVKVIAETAFTSSGTIGTSTLVLGLVREDRTTELDYDGLTTTSFVGSVIDAAGETTDVRPGVTGCGALVGTTLANDGLLCVANSQHASHPFTAGKARIVISGYYP